MKPEDIQRFEKFIAKLQGLKQQGDYQYMSLCPAHGDANVSLWTKLDEKGKIHVDCKAGCGVHAICESLGFKISFLYGAPQIVATYDYITAEGEFLYQEVKYDKESLSRFAVRRLNKKYKEKRNTNGDIINAHDKWKWDTKNTPLILFNLHDVISSRGSAEDYDKREDRGVVFMCEGPKDAKTLAKLGLVATAALINDWAKTDTSPLNGRCIIILVDNDKAGEIKALKAAHDRYGKSNSVKLLRLPGLRAGGDVTDWLEVGGENTKEKLLALSLSGDLPEWHPQDSIRERINNGEMTGLAFEHGFPGPIWETWRDVYHPVTEGELISYDKDWLKGCIKSLLYNETHPDTQLKTIMRLLKYCSNAKSKDSNEEFKPTPRDAEEILRAYQIDVGIDMFKYTTIPIFRSSFMPKHEQSWKPIDIVIMKTHNFHIPSKRAFPRDMQSCIARHALPFDYDSNAKCPGIERSLRVQWGDDQESIDLLLQFIFYCMISAPGKYKSILSMVGVPNTGKSIILSLITEFIGVKSCEAISLSKLGLQFELFRTIFSKVLICDDENVTKKDFAEGTLTENLLSIPAGRPIRVERKGGAIETRIIPAQIIIAGNRPIRMHANSSGLSERLKFLVFRHIYKRGNDMNENIMDIWRTELPGLMNLVLDAGEKLIDARGFIEPKSSIDKREEFERGANPVLRLIREYMDQNDISDPVQWVVTIENMKVYYKLYCDDFEVKNKLSVQAFNEAMESIPGIIKKTVRKEKINRETGKGTGEFTTVRCWSGLRRKGTDGTIDDRRAMNDSRNSEF